MSYSSHSHYRAIGSSILAGITLSFFLLGSSCNGGGDGPAAATVSEARLPDAVVDGMDPMPSPDVSFAQVELPNGMLAADFLALFPTLTDQGGPTGPQDTKNYLIALMAQEAARLTNDSIWTFADEGPDQPEQAGLAYVFGGKQVGFRSRGAKSCSPLLYGLDCSGFVALCFSAAGVPLPVGPASSQRSVSVLDSALDSFSRYEPLYTQDLGALPTSEIESGDIVYWNDSLGATQHIGIVLNGAVFQSNGSSSCEPVQLLRNRGSSRGPRQFALSQLNTFFASSGLRLGGVVRILADISGTWRFNMRCQAASFDVLDAQVEFPPSQSGQFQVVQDFTDYNGQPVTGSFDFTYTRESNLLSCVFGLSTPSCSTNPFRVETFSVQLDRDDTNYVPTTGVNRTPCSGCDISVRFRNLESGGVPDQLQILIDLLDEQPARTTIGPPSGG